ncbi:DUF1772 domain-containing protein [Bradyrhizobium sp. HKCCYLS3077]|uniref:anthrone oxygenase family protein n=1 Tax=Bradyrhizobium sp. HKCCYLS3077 TaxID=3420761 RepID=UPI003EBB3D5C
MNSLLVSGLLWFAAIGCGLMAGVYFAFSTFVMAALSRIPPASGIAAMNAINLDIVNSLFIPLFMGTTFAAALLAVFAVVRWGEPGSFALLTAGILYVLGMFVVTLALNVPLNNALAAVDPASPQGAALWASYVRDWSVWNHLRTFASLGSALLFMLALVAH